MSADPDVPPPARPGAGPRAPGRLRLGGLAPRVAAYLSIALLPLGLIALYQTSLHQREAETRAELSLLALTELGAAGVGSAIERAIGAGAAVAAGADLLADSGACSRTLARLAAPDSPFDFAGLLPRDGASVCNSVGRPIQLDPDASAELARLVAAPGLAVRPSEDRDDVLVVAMPYPDAAASQGYLAFTVPLNRLGPRDAGAGALTPLRLVTFNEGGEILTGGADAAGTRPLADLLPEGERLADHAGAPAHVFEAETPRGDPLVYTVTPLVPGVAYAMGIWTPDQGARGTGAWGEAPFVFPLVMWAASLFVAFWAIHRLVIRHAVDLVGRMRTFASDRSLAGGPPEPGTPSEFREIEEAFRQMGQSILQDEARMENAFRERGVLLREVHHRVKNNLQLISSIISMQVRRMPDPALRRTLRRLQDRVLTLAAIYRTLYTSSDMTDVNAAPVLRAIVEQELRAAGGAVDATLDIEDLVLEPDKVVPLAFLAAEAVSNAVQRAASDEGRPSVSVTLHRHGADATLRIANSVAAAPPVADAAPAAGLGQHLIHAFAAQVGAPVETHLGDRLHVLSITFPTEPAPLETADA